MREEQIRRLGVGDVVILDEPRLGSGSRTGEIVETLGGPRERRWRVRWRDGRDGLLYPGRDVRVPRRPRAAGRRR